MPIVVTCECGRRLQIKEEHAGQEGRCPACGHIFPIPELTSNGEPAPVLDLPLRLTTEPRPVSTPSTTDDDAVLELEPVRNHAGEPLPPGLDFFVPPPEEIGPVVTATSTLQSGVRPRTPGNRAAITGGYFLIGAAIILFFVGLGTPREIAHYVVWPTIVGSICGLSAFLVTRFRHTCSYVGREGVARFRCAGERGNIVLGEVFLFRDAAELRTSQTRRYVNGAYQGTDYRFTWTDVTGRTRYVWKGTHKSQEGNPKPRDPFHFGRSAEIAWTIYLLPTVLRQIDLGGSALFTLGGDRWLRLGPGFVLIHWDGSEEQWDAKEIGNVVINNGMVHVRRHDAREGWFSSTGVFKFPFANLGNAQLFFHLMEKVVGVRVG